MYRLIKKGKIREMYQIDDDYIAMVTSDKLSAFDVVLPDTFSCKGGILADITEFWMNRFSNNIRNHLAPFSIIDLDQLPKPIKGHVTAVKKLTPLPVEAIVRGYLIGSGWKDYQARGAISGIQLPPGLQLASKLPTAIFTPSTKAEQGDHDENITFYEAADIIGMEMANLIKQKSLFMFGRASEYLEKLGIIIADTKFEFGVDNEGKLHLIDEVLTPDSSRYWDKEEYKVGISPPSFDKQIVRDYLETLDWDKTAPGPRLPDDIIKRTAQRYREIADRILGY